MIRYHEALQILRALRLDLGTERLPLDRCGGRVLAEDLTARISSPPYTNSAMDGFAVRHADAAAGVPLEVAGTILARPIDPREIPVARAGACVRIMTGGYLPDWADTVIPVEQSALDPDGRVRFTSVSDKGANIRHEGDDLRAGDLLMKAGVLLEPERIMVAAAFGFPALAVERKPRLVILSTGDELVEPGEALQPGALYNSSKYFLTASAQKIGLQAEAGPTIPDDEKTAATMIEAALAAGGDGAPTVLLTTGAVSAGEADFIPKVAQRLGFEALLHRVAIRPGKPVFLARRGNAVWLGLPGNAISTSVGWHIFARPLLAAVGGFPEPTKGTVVLANEVRKPEGLRCFFRAELTGGRAWVAKRQGSAELAASITNAAYVELPEDTARLPVDTKVEAFFL